MARITVVLLAVAALPVAPVAAVAQRLVTHASFWTASPPPSHPITSPMRGALAPVAPMLRAGATLPARVSWRASDVALAGAFAVALAIDAAQTRGLAQHGWQTHREANPILGPRPSVGQVNTYTAAAAVTVLGVAAVVPRRVRPWLLGAALAVETFTVAGNTRHGVALKFP
jgi:hypothetical protein